MWFDSHCHLDFDEFSGDRPEVLEAARRANVRQIFIPGVEPGSWSALAKYAQVTQGVCAGIGIHPHYLRRVGEAQLDAALQQLPAWCDRTGAVAVGECGLDGALARRGGPSLAEQGRVFQRHIDVATELSLPLVLHIVRAHGEALVRLKKSRPRAGGVIHAYSGSAQLVSEYVKLGFYFAFGAAVTRDRALKARAALARVPADRLLVETDAPDQAALGAQARNEPSALPAIGATIAALRGVTAQELAAETTANARRVFGLAPPPCE